MEPVETRKQVVSAVTVLKELNEKYNQSDKKKLLLDDSQDGPVFLTVSLKKLPNKNLKKDIKINLPHCFFTENSDVCLIAGDLEKNNRKAEVEPDVQKIKLFLSEKDIKNISEVVTLRQLRTEYKEYCTRNQLVNAHDVFLCDKVIAQCLPKLLGKAFFKRNKFPLQIDLKGKNLKEQINKKLSTVVFPLNCKGNSCSARVARLGMQPSDIADNVIDSLKVLSESIPGGWDNVKGVHIKLQKSAAIPIYQSLDSACAVKLPRPKSNKTSVTGELNTLSDDEDDKVRVHDDGSVFVLSEKKKIKSVVRSKKRNPFVAGSKRRKMRRFAKTPKSELKDGKVKIENEKDGKIENKLVKNKMDKRRAKKPRVESNDSTVEVEGHSVVEEKEAAKVASISRKVRRNRKNVVSEKNAKGKGLKRKHQDSENVEKKKSAEVEKEPQSNKNIGDEATKKTKKIPIPGKKKIKLVF